MGRFTNSGTEAIIVGDVVCLGASLSSEIRKATPTALLTARAIVGVAITVAEPGASVDVAETGVLDKTLTGLTSGTACLVAVDRAARMARVPKPNGAEYLVGTCDTEGNLVLQPRASHGLSPRHVFNVRAYGAVGDGVTDDAPAFRAAMAAMGTTKAGGYARLGNVLEVPDAGDGDLGAVYYIASTIKIERGCVIRGVASGVNNSRVRIFAAPGVTPFETEHSSSAVTPGADAAGCSLERLDIRSTRLSIPDYRGAGRRYDVGDRIRIRDDNRWYFECTTGGHTAPTPEYADPAWNYYPNQTIVDGSVTWMCRLHTGVWIRTRTKVRDCHFLEFTNAGIHIQAASGDATNASGWLIEQTRIVQCGVGLSANGGDAQAGLAIGVDVEAPGHDQPGTAGHGIVDESFLGNTFIACQVAAGTGRAYIVEHTAARAVLLGCYSEADMLPSKLASGVVLGGDHGAGFDWSAFKATLISDMFGARNTFARYPEGTLGATAFLDRHDEGDYAPCFAMNTKWDGGSSLGWRYQRLGSAAPGAWILSFAPYNIRGSFGLTAVQASEGPGHWLDVYGHFAGPSAARYLAMKDSASWTSPYWRKGQRLRGDRLEPKGSPSIGTFLIEKVVTSDGYEGTTWSPEQGYGLRNYVFGTPSAIVRPTSGKANGYSYRLIKARGRTGRIEPDWPTTVGLDLIVWHVGLSLKLDDIVRPVEPNGHLYRVANITLNAGNYHFSTGAVEPAPWPEGSGSSIVETSDKGSVTYTEIGPDNPASTVRDGQNEWICIGAIPSYGVASLVEHPAYAPTPQIEQIWRDTNATPSAMNAPNTTERRKRRDARTTTNAANQVLGSYPVPTDATTVFNVTIAGNRKSTPDGCSITLSGTFKRSGIGAPLRIGADGKTVKRSDGMGSNVDANLKINGTDIEIHVSPNQTAAIDWSIVWTAVEGVSA